MFDPTVGRWFEEDPSGLTTGPNLYEYVGNNPTNVIDPSGLDLFYLLDTEAVGGAGHAALLIHTQEPIKFPFENLEYKLSPCEKAVVESKIPKPDPNKESRYLFLSVAAPEKILSGEVLKGLMPGNGGVPIKLDAAYYSTWDEFSKSKFGKRYNVAIQFICPDKNTIEAVKAIAEKWNNAGFRLLWNNCSNMVLDGLIAAELIGGKDVPKFPGPNWRGKMIANLYKRPSRNWSIQWSCVECRLGT
jgi:hypothetical protein